MKAPIDTKKIAADTAMIHKIALASGDEPVIVRLCGYVEHLLSERKMLLDMVAIGHSNFPFLRGHFECDCNLCTEHRELTTVGGTDERTV